MHNRHNALELIVRIEPDSLHFFTSLWTLGKSPSAKTEFASTSQHRNSIFQPNQQARNYNGDAFPCIFAAVLAATHRGSISLKSTSPAHAPLPLHLAVPHAVGGSLFPRFRSRALSLARSPFCPL